MNFKDVTELPRETGVVFSSRVNPITYRCGNSYSLKEKNLCLYLGYDEESDPLLKTKLRSSTAADDLYKPPST